MSRTAPAGYSRAQIVLHWVIAVLIVLQFVFHDGIEAAADALERGGAVPPDLALTANLHVWLGIAVLALAALRLWLRLTRGAPPMPAGTAPVQARIASAIHGAFYGLLFFAPVSGAVAWFVNADAGNIHEFAKPLFIILTALHVLGALHHAILKRDGLMRRMVVPTP